MKDLKSENGKVIWMFAFENEEDVKPCINLINITSNLKVLFSGTKSELLGKKEEWCKELVEEIIFEYLVPSRLSPYRAYRFKNYLDPSFEAGGKLTAKESLISALENENEFILITEETLN